MLVMAYKIKKDKAEWRALLNHLEVIKKFIKIKIVVNKVFYNQLPVSELENFEFVVIKNKLELFSILNSNNETIFNITLIDVVETKLFGFFKKFRNIYWVQGIAPEESYLRNNSWLRYKVLSYIENIALKYSTKHIYVSSYMVEYFKKKYRFDSRECFVIPCFSDLIYTGEEKIRHSYCYLGGFSKWQKIEESIMMFQFISKNQEKAKLSIITRDIDKVNEVIDKKFISLKSKIKVFSLSNRVELSEVLSKIEFGFLLRDDIALNHVSSPVKLAEYLSCDVNVIISDAIKSYANLIHIGNCGVVIDDGFNLKQELQYRKSNALNLFKKSFDKSNFINGYKNMVTGES